jgi:alpha-glucuronidase
LLVASFLKISNKIQIYTEDGDRLWSGYEHVSDASRLLDYKNHISGILTQGQSPTLVAVRKELTSGLSSLLGTNIP